MNLCSDTHDEVCFEGRECPACEVINKLTKDLEAAVDMVTSLEQTIDEYRTDLRAMAREAQKAQEDVAKESIE